MATRNLTCEDVGCPCVTGVPDSVHVDPRDAEIARLKAEVSRLRRCLVVVGDQAVALGARYGRALAAGPAALREGAPSLWSGEAAAREIERAQSEAMKEEP